MNSIPQQPSSIANQIYQALEDVEHAEFAEITKGHLYISRDAKGEIKALNQKGSSASFNEITKWVKEALSASELTNDQKFHMLENYKSVVDRFKWKMSIHIPDAMIAFFRGQTRSAREAEKMIAEELKKIGYGNEKKVSGGTLMRGKIEGDQLVEGIKQNEQQGLFEKGHFKNNELDGQGIRYLFLNTSYPTSFCGQFANGRFKEGTKTIMNQTLETGTVYQGQFDIQGNLSGKGTKTVNGDIYEGTFTNGQMNGLGKVTWKGESYETHFQPLDKNRIVLTITKTKNIVLSTILKWLGAPGFVSSHTQAAGKYGKEITQPGTVWEGEFVNDKLEGEVKITLPDGKMGIGTFQTGRCTQFSIR